MPRVLRVAPGQAIVYERVSMIMEAMKPSVRAETSKQSAHIYIFNIQQLSHTLFNTCRTFPSSDLRPDPNKTCIPPRGLWEAHEDVFYPRPGGH